MHQELQDPHPPSIDRFVSELRYAILECDGTLGGVKVLLEAALRVALDGHDAP